MQVKFEICPLFSETFGNHPEVLRKLGDFISQKTRDPLSAFGPNDKVFARKTPMSELLPKLRKAHLTHDISVLYDIGGRDPIFIKLYAILSHDESGTGQPSNMRIQRSIAKRLSQQSFEPFRK